MGRIDSAKRRSNAAPVIKGMEAGMETILTPGEQPAFNPAVSGHPKRPVRSSYRRQLDPYAHRRELHARHVSPLATGLGWFSIGIGVVQLVAPRQLGRAIGLEARPMVMQAMGAREIASGIGILSRPGRSGWLWSRVAGDAIDFGVLAVTARKADREQQRRIAVLAAAVAGVAALDVMASVRQSRMADEFALDSLTLEKSITVNRPPDEVYQFWRDFENFPRFMRHLESVIPLGGNRSRWRARGPFGRSVEWDAELTIDEPGKMLAWRSLEGADVRNAGTVRFESTAAGRGTIVHVDFDYRPPGGWFGALVARLSGEEPQLQVDGDLRRFKQLLETGEIPTIDGQPAGRRSMLVRLIRAGVTR